MEKLTGNHFLAIIDEIFAYPQNYTGFAIKADGGTVGMLAYKFNIARSDVLIVLNQMLTDFQLIEVGMVGFDMTYGPIKE